MADTPKINYDDLLQHYFEGSHALTKSIAGVENVRTFGTFINIVRTFGESSCT